MYVVDLKTDLPCTCTSLKQSMCKCLALLWDQEVETIVSKWDIKRGVELHRDSRLKVITWLWKIWREREEEREIDIHRDSRSVEIEWIAMALWADKWFWECRRHKSYHFPSHTTSKLILGYIKMSLFIPPNPTLTPGHLNTYCNINGRKKWIGEYQILLGI